MTDRHLRSALGSVLALSVILVAVGATGPARTAVLLVFVLFVPGTAWSRHLRLNDTTDTIGVGLAVSIALAALVGEAMAVAKWWHPGVGGAVLAAVALAGLALPLRAPESDDQLEDQLDQTRT